MRNIPASWENVPVKDVIRECHSGFASGQKNVEDGVKQLRMNNIGVHGDLDLSVVRKVPQSLARPQHFLQSGDVLVCTTNSAKLVGKSSFFDLPERYVISNHLTRLRPDPLVIDGKFLRWVLWLHWQAGDFTQHSKHWVNQSSLPREALLEQRISVPPLPEQKRLIAFLDPILERARSCRERMARIPKLVNQFRQNILVEAASGNLTSDWRINTGSLSEAAVGNWKTVPACDACKIVQSGSTPSKDRFQSTPGIPFLKVYNLVDQKIDFEYKPQFIAQETHQNSLKKSIVWPGDVLMNIVGPPLGKVALVPDTYAEWNINQALVVFRPKESLNHQFLYYLLSSGIPYADVLQQARGSAGQANISLTQCREMQLPIPSLPEQEEVVRRVGELFMATDAILRLLQHAKKHTDRLALQVLTQAYHGDLIPRFPGDGTTKEILARILAERAGSPQRREKTARVKRMKTKPLSAESVKAAIQEMPEHHFLFDELRKNAQGDYDSLQKIVFELLKEGYILQEFDQESGTMRFNRSNNEIN